MLCVQLCQLMSDLCIICTIPLTLCGTGATFSTMKLITTIVRPERLPEVKAALFQAGITGITLSRVSGHGGEQEIVSQYRGTTVVMEFHEKVKIEMVCSEPYDWPQPARTACCAHVARSRRRHTVCCAYNAAS